MTSLPYRPEIDGLRAIAVLFVVGFHAFPTIVHGGYVGVDAFFVISGYLITGILLKSMSRGDFSIIGFYVARIRRILPALLVVLASCLIFGYVALFPDELRQLSLHVAGAAIFVSNIILWREAGYFDGAAITKPLLHLWSLGIEEQFYLVWPFLLATALLAGRRAIWIVGALALASFAANVLLIDLRPSATFYLPVTRAWELLLGALIAMVPQRPKSGPVRNVISMTGLCALILAVVLFTPETVFPGWSALLPAMGTSLLIFAGSGGTIAERILALPPLVAIGRISYPLYLWHWPLLSFSSIVNGAFPEGPFVWILLCASFCLAAATHLLVELPSKRAIQTLPKRAVLPIVLLVGLGSASWTVFLHDGLDDRPAFKLANAANEQIGSSHWEYSENDICRDRYEGDWDLFCIQNRSGEPTIMLVGNSYANHLYPGTVDAYPGETVLNIGTCDPAMRGNDNSDCELQDAVIAANPNLKLIFLSSDWDWTISPELATAFRRRLEWMASQGKQIVVLGPKLDLPFHIRECFARPLQSTPKSCDLPVGAAGTLRPEITQMLQAAVKGIPGAIYYDQMPLFCGPEKCSPIHDGLPLLRDDGHYSVYGSILAMHALAEQLALSKQ